MVNLSKFLVVLCILLVPTVLQAQNTAIIKGKIVDSETGDDLIAATVVLKDLNDKIITGAQTKYDGSYLLRKIKPGSYKLVVNYVGYTQKTVDNLEVKPGDELSLDISLSPDAIMTEEVVVEARAIKDNSAALLKERSKAASSQDAIGNKEMEKKGAGDAGEALKKVTGVTIKDGKNVVVRGLSNRYAKTQLNGAALPSSDPDSRSVDLDMFSTGMIENIVTIKTATPDKPGDFTGGAVDIRTKSYPDKFFASVGISTNYNFQVTGNDLLIGERSDTDWLGMGDGTREFPNSMENLLDKYGEDNFPDANNIISPDGTTSIDVDNDPDTPDEVFQNSEIINDLDMVAGDIEDVRMAPIFETAPISTGLSFGIGNQYKIGKSTPIGFTANLNYSRNFSSYRDGVFAIYDLPSLLTDSLNLVDYFSDQQGEENNMLSGMAGITTTLFDYNEVGVNFIYNQATTNRARFVSGRRPGSSGIPTKGFSSWSNRFIERDLYSFQVRGSHKFNWLESINLDKTNLEWQVSTSQNTRSEPNFRLFAYEWVPEVQRDLFNSRPNTDTLVQDGENWRLYNPETDGDFDPSQDSITYEPAQFGLFQSNYNEPARIFREMTETNLNFTVDLEVPLDDILGIPFKIKTGALIERVDRSFTEEWIAYRWGNKNFQDDVNGDRFIYNPDQNPNSLFNRLVGVTQDDFGFYNPFMTYNFQSPNVNSYDASSDINAFYGMVDFKVGDLRVITGLRVEESNLRAIPRDDSDATLRRFQNEWAEVNGYDPNNPADTALIRSIQFDDFGIQETDFLPSLNLVYALTKKTNLRGAYYRTLARPNLREMAPYNAFDFIGGFLVNGNPFLKRVLIDNYDLRFEWFPNAGELIGLSVYYKDFTNPIELNLVSVNGQVRYLNAPSAQLLGAEFEIRKNIGNIIEDLGANSPRWIKNFDFSFNLTLTDAQVDIAASSRDAKALLAGEQSRLDTLFARGEVSSNVLDTNSVLKRDFVGQSPYVVNFDLSYSDPELGLNISSNFNVFGRRLDFIQLGIAPDVYEMPRPELNFIISKTFFDDLKIKFTANNLLNPLHFKTQEHNGVEYDVQRFRIGSSVAFSLSYTFN